MIKYSLENLDLNKLGLASKLYLPFSDGRLTGVWRENEEVIGLIQGKSLDEANPSEIYVEYFEVVTKGEGYGYKCIKSLFKKYNNLHYINGQSEEGAELFWESIGGFFPTACDDCGEIEICISQGYQCENRLSSEFTLYREEILIDEV